jgi:hypothetical protein
LPSSDILFAQSRARAFKEPSLARAASPFDARKELIRLLNSDSEPDRKPGSTPCGLVVVVVAGGEVVVGVGRGLGAVAAAAVVVVSGIVVVVVVVVALAASSVSSTSVADSTRAFISSSEMTRSIVVDVDEIARSRGAAA